MYRAASYRLGIVSTYVPRRCGLATYTADLREALGVATDDIDSVVVAIDRDGLSYGDEVVATIRQDHIADYEDVADRIRAAGIDVVLIQHEYGIFGGPNGSHVLHLARALTTRDIPYLVTLHTLLSQPTPGQAATLSALCSGAAGVTVFTETAREMAVRAGIAAAHQITVVPHGAPSVLREAPTPVLADVLDPLGDDPVLTTFGLVSAGKGLEDAITALSRVVQRHPRTRYVIAGATHPEVVRLEGESYRDALHERVRRLGLVDNVRFVDRFLTPAELAALLHRTTIFVTPYRSPEQICSGALTFAVAAGCPVVSTAYSYAEDLLASGAGLTVPCHDVVGLADAVTSLLDDPAALAATRAAADRRGASLTWPAVALAAGELIRGVARRAPSAGTVKGGPAPIAVPPLRLSHLRRLTDEFGIIEFCRGREPDLDYGYNVDDVSRLGIVAADLLSVGRGGDAAEAWVRLALRFLRAALPEGPDAVMHNRMTYGGSWTDDPHPGDHVGRTVWALGTLAGCASVPDSARREATELLDSLVPRIPALAGCGPRSVGYALLGLVRADRTAPLADLVAGLDRQLRAHAGTGWYWFEPELTYDNARLPQALLAGATVLGDRAVAARALTALDWYAEHVGLTTGTLRNVGNRWHRRDDDPVRWGDAGDEQPIDTAGAVEALVEAWRYTRGTRYAHLAGVAYSWFHGRNRAGAVLYETDNGACHDGLAATTANPNCGAESTLAHQQAMLTLVRAGLASWPDRPSPGYRIAGRARPPAPPTTPSTPGRTPPVRPKHRTRTTEGHNDAR